MAKQTPETEADLTGGEPRRRPRHQPLEVGGRRLSPSTLMMGHGFDPALSEGSLKPPVFLTSTYVFESAAAGVAERNAPPYRVLVCGSLYLAGEVLRDHG